MSKEACACSAVYDRAVEVLGTKAKASDWLETMSRTLGGKPCDLLATEEGRERVLRHLRSVELACRE